MSAMAQMAGLIERSRAFARAAYGDIPRARLGDPAVVQISLQGQLAGLRRVPIDPKAALPGVPIIRGGSAIGEHRLVASKGLPVGPIVNLGA